MPQRGRGVAATLKRIPINYHDFLRDVLSRAALNIKEKSLLNRALQEGRPAEMERTARALVDSLVDRGALTILDQSREGDFEWLRLRDPQHRFRIRIRLPIRRYAPETRTIPLPLEHSARSAFRHHEVQGLLSIQGNLVSHDRVMTPRDLVQRMERAMKELVSTGTAVFHVIEMPPGEDWTAAPNWNGLPARPEQLETLGRQRDHLILYPDLGRDGSLLFMGLGDEATGWRGVLALRHPDREHFSQERLALAVMVAQHFQNLLSTCIRLQGLIFYDFLTGIYNRSYFEEQLEREIAVADRRGQSLGLLIIDIDDFKAFNTRYGYEGGDRVLATVACVLKSALRHTDTLARHGGEEFAAILSPPVPREEARMISQRLWEAVANEPLTMRSLDGKTVAERITVSIGGVLYPEGARNGRELWNAANRLLLEAKDRGKNQVRFWGDA